MKAGSDPRGGQLLSLHGCVQSPQLGRAAGSTRSLAPQLSALPTQAPHPKAPRETPPASVRELLGSGFAGCVFKVYSSSVVKPSGN